MLPSTTDRGGREVLTLPVLIILAVLWAVVLMPPLLRSRSQRTADSIVDFNYKLDVLGSDQRQPRELRRTRLACRRADALARSARGAALRGTRSARRRATRAVPALPARPRAGAAFGEAAARRAARARRSRFSCTLLRRGRSRVRAAAWALQIFVDVVAGRVPRRCGHGRAVCRPSASTRCATCRSCERPSSRCGAARRRSRSGGPARRDRRDRRPRPRDVRGEAPRPRGDDQRVAPGDSGLRGVDPRHAPRRVRRGRGVGARSA